MPEAAPPLRGRAARTAPAPEARMTSATPSPPAA